MSVGRDATGAAGTHPATVLRQARIVAAALTAGPVPLLALALVFRPQLDLSRWVLPAGLAGLGSLVVAYRLYRLLRERGTAFVVATAAPLAVTEAAALVGILVFWSERHPIALAGLLAHLLAAGAVWPTAVRLEVHGRAGPGGDRR